MRKATVGVDWEMSINMHQATSPISLFPHSKSYFSPGTEAGDGDEDGVRRVEDRKHQGLFHTLIHCPRSFTDLEPNIL